MNKTGFNSCLSLLLIINKLIPTSCTVNDQANMQAKLQVLLILTTVTKINDNNFNKYELTMYMYDNLYCLFFSRR